jgi:anaerobic magnesium-protoporphyrin IX monomethyl ester cyclase
MSQVLFGQSYYLRFDSKLYAAMQPYPPLGALYAASYLRSRGYDVALFDAMLAESEDEWQAALIRHQPRYAILYEDNFNYLSKMCLLRMRDAAFKMIAMAKARGCTVILCGADVADRSAMYFAHGADYALIGEGEETLGELMDRLQGRTDTPLESILGLAWPDGHGGEQRSPRRPDITQLDELPFPAWDLVDIPRYQAIWRKHHGYYSMNMVTTRGCPYHCNWCAKPIWGQRYNSRSPENVVAEMKWLKETYHPEHVWFADDIFGLRRGWIERFTQLVVEQDAHIPFKCLLRADLVKPSVVEALHAAGCQTVWMGAESGSQKILDAMDKGTTVAQIHQARRWLGEAGIRVGFFLQFGYPGETRADIEQTLQMLRETLPDEIGISVSYPLPGTKFYERVKSELGQKQNWVDSDDLAMLYHGPFSQEFYRTLYRAVHFEFGMRQAWREVKHDLPHPSHWRPRHERLLASIPWRWLKWQIAQAQWSQMAHTAPVSSHSVIFQSASKT